MNVGILMSVSIGSWAAVASQIEKAIKSINEMFQQFFAFITNTEIYDNIMKSIPEDIKSTVAATALSLAVLLFFVNFLGKTMNLQWVTWENVLMLVLQLVLAKVVIQNAEPIMGAIQKTFSSMVGEVKEIEFIPHADANYQSNVSVEEVFKAIQENDTEKLATLLEQNQANSGALVGELTANPAPKNRERISVTGRAGAVFLWFGDKFQSSTLNVPTSYFYFLDKDDAAIAYIDGLYEAGIREDKVTFDVKTETWDFSPVMAAIGVFVNSFLMKCILIVALVMMISRFMWLAVYTVAAPLPLATFASDETKEIGKSFLKSYVGVCLHAMVMVIICTSFSAVTTSITSVTTLGGFVGLIKTFAFGGLVMKSESVSNKICGAM